MVALEPVLETLEGRGMKETLSASRWDGLADRLGIAAPLVAFRWLEAHYQERARKYHNPRHINECLAVLDRSTHPEAANPIVEYAIWFHDAVYNTFSRKNEERSADAGVKVLERSGRSAAECALARELILATRHGTQPADPAAQLMVDVDLSILGAEAERYAEFELQIRAEYWWVPTAMYRKERGAILHSFVMRPSVYATHEFRERYERQARNNLAWGMEQLAFGRATFRWTARF
jgi:predicted metal-dependent HD superfamily phosphohydrolase